MFAARFDPSSEDELDRAFSLWRQADYLREFFIKYRADLRRFDPGMKVQSAVHMVINEAERIYDTLVETAMHDRLNELFRPLDNREEYLPRYELQKLKARDHRRKSILRLYAVKFMGGYIIGGSAIKITQRMDRPHLKAELHKLELLKQYLQTDGINGDFVYLDIDL